MNKTFLTLSLLAGGILLLSGATQAATRVTTPTPPPALAPVPANQCTPLGLCYWVLNQVCKGAPGEPAQVFQERVCPMSNVTSTGFTCTGVCYNSENIYDFTKKNPITVNLTQGWPLGSPRSRGQ